MPGTADNVERLNWLIKAVNSYNKYLIRSLRLQIDTSKIYPRLVIESDEKIDDSMKSISGAFEDIDKLTPAKNISHAMKLNSEELFLKRSFGPRIMAWGTLVTTILPVVISIVTTWLIPPRH